VDLFVAVLADTVVVVVALLVLGAEQAVSASTAGMRYANFFTVSVNACSGPVSGSLGRVSGAKIPGSKTGRREDRSVPVPQFVLEELETAVARSRDIRTDR
jgi:hypothetical protein